MSGYVCRSCGQWQDQPLTASNPFDPNDTVVGCLHCKEVGQIVFACHTCRNEATAGAPTVDGYRWSCSKHLPPEQTKENTQ